MALGASRLFNVLERCNRGGQLAQYFLQPQVNQLMLANKQGLRNQLEDLPR